MADESEKWVVLVVASSPFEARVIAGVLEDAGIPCQIDVGTRPDEFSVTQQLMNLQGTEVRVPAELRGRAEEALAEAREAAAVLDDAGPEDAGEEGYGAAVQDAETEDAGGDSSAVDGPGMREGAGSSRWAWLATLVAIVFALLWNEERGERRALEAAFDNPVFESEAGAEGWRMRWRDTGRVAYEYVDGDGDRVAERVRGFDRQGRLFSVSIDADENGVFERWQAFNRAGELVEVVEDADQDGRFDGSRWLFPDGLEVRAFDGDGDGRNESLVLERDGEELVRQELRGEAGYVVVDR